jgi:peroxiredoxin Q/BCP
MLDINTQAPNFSLPDQNETIHTLYDYTTQWKLVYFYPKDDTPGCTKEACAIAEVYDEFIQLNVAVLGVSKDAPQSHKKFAEKYNLPFTLLSDPEATMIAQYEALGEKSMFGKKHIGITRISYLINPANTIVHVYPKVDPATHALELLADIKKFQTS